MNIHEFEEAVRQHNHNHEYRTVTQIGFNREYYGVTFDPDATVELDAICQKEETMKKLVEYFTSKHITIMEPDFHILEYGWNQATIPGWEPVKHEIKYYYEKEYGWYRLNMLPQGKQISNIYQFIQKTGEKLKEMAIENDDTIRLVPFQVDQVVDGEVHFTKHGVSNSLTFTFDADYPRTSYITACVLNQVCNNQEQFDALMDKHN